MSLNQASKPEGYGSVPESRVVAPSSWVAGVSGRFVLSQERRRTATDLGISVAFAKQGMTGAGSGPASESADDVKIDVTFRPPTFAEGGYGWKPYVRGLYDTEFTPTEDPKTHVRNPRQMAVRATGGLLRMPTPTWRRVEIGLAVENDLGQPNLQYGVQGALEFERRFGGRSGNIAVGELSYRLRNDLTYFLPSAGDKPNNLALRYNMVHELTVPLVDELSLAIAADFFMYQGKVATNRTPGTSMLLRVGPTYDRLWKPRYQPFL